MSAVLLALLALTPQDFDRSEPAPVLERIEVGRDTVWFLERARSDAPTLAYVYLRSSKRWVRLGRIPPRNATPSLPRSPTDRVWLAPGFDLVLLEDSTEMTYGVWSRREDRIYVLKPELHPEDRRCLKIGERFEIESDSEVDNLPVAREIGAWVRDGDVVWFGLAGGFSEGQGGLGGLMRFDLERGELEPIWHEDLLQAEVTGLGVAGGGLWIGTLRPGEYGPYEASGVLRYDLDTRNWARTANAALPSNLIWSLAAAGNRVWISTARGLAALDTKTGVWEARSFFLTLSGDTIVHEFVEGRRPADPAREGIFLLMQDLGVERREAFLHAALKLPGEPFANYIRGEWDAAGYALAHPSLVPFVEAALAQPGRPRRLAAEAIGRLGDRRWTIKLLTLLDTVANSDNAAIALALGRMGDSTGYRWIRDRLSRASYSEDLTDVIRGAAQLRDVGSIPGLFRALRTTKGNHDAAYHALHDIGTVEMWRQLAAAVPTYVDLPLRFFTELLHAPGTMPLSDSTFRAAIAYAATQQIISGQADRMAAGLDVFVTFGPAEAIPGLMSELMGRMTFDETHYSLILPALIQLTAVDSAPLFPGTDGAQRRKAWRFWSDWWTANRQTFSPAPAALGQAALARWRERYQARWQIPFPEH